MWSPAGAQRFEGVQQAASQSLDDPETILLIDSWASQEAIDAHHATQMMATIASLREKYDLHMTVERYTGTDMPETDNQFIRH